MNHIYKVTLDGRVIYEGPSRDAAEDAYEKLEFRAIQQSLHLLYMRDAEVIMELEP